MTERKAAFTLAETLITLTILGVIAAITIPGVVRRQIEAANRTKIKKAMKVYDFVMNNMTVENGIKDNTALKNFAGDENNNCAGSSSYFKIAEGSGCRFKTSDGVWWDISDINRVIIALKEEDLNKTTADSDTNRAFYLLSWFDDNGTLRIDDLAAATGGDKDIIAKVYDFISAKTKTSNEKISQENPESELAKKCKSGELTCTKKTLEVTEISHFGNDDEDWGELCIWTKEDGQTCPYTSTAQAGDLYFTEPVSFDAYESYLDSDSSDCENWCKDYDYYNAAKRYCEDKGGRLPTVAELQAGGYTNGFVWASEEYNSYSVLALNNGRVWGEGKFGVDSVVCVGK